jgi:hypothetical protein
MELPMRTASRTTPRPGAFCWNAVLLLALSGTLAACGSVPAAAPTQPPTLAEMLATADRERSAGSTAKAQELLQAAAAAHPASKEPWLRLAQMHFDAKDYGHAIAAADQALQRDANDVLAASTLVVSGLRVSTGAVATLRQSSVASGVPADSRAEATQLAIKLNDAMGGPVLVLRDPPSGQKPAGNAGKPTARPAAGKPGDPFKNL